MASRQARWSKASPGHYILTIGDKMIGAVERITLSRTYDGRVYGGGWDIDTVCQDADRRARMAEVRRVCKRRGLCS